MISWFRFIIILSWFIRRRLVVRQNHQILDIIHFNTLLNIVHMWFVIRWTVSHKFLIRFRVYVFFIGFGFDQTVDWYLAFVTLLYKARWFVLIFYCLMVIVVSIQGSFIFLYLIVTSEWNYLLHSLFFVSVKDI